MVQGALGAIDGFKENGLTSLVGCLRVVTTFPRTAINSMTNWSRWSVGNFGTDMRLSLSQTRNYRPCGVTTLCAFRAVT